MKLDKRKRRRLAKHCNGCNKDFPKNEWDDHILSIIKGFRT